MQRTERQRSLKKRRSIWQNRSGEKRRILSGGRKVVVQSRYAWIGFLLPSMAGVLIFVLLPFLVVVRRSFLTAVTEEWIGLHLLPEGVLPDYMGTGASFWVLVFSYIWKNLGYTIVLWLAGIFFCIRRSDGSSQGGRRYRAAVLLVCGLSQPEGITVYDHGALLSELF